MRKSKNCAMDEHLLVFRRGSEALEEFEGEQRLRRGIKRRFKHDIEGVLIYDAELLAQLQEGHKHTTLYEAILLLQGEIKACCWDDEGRIETKSLCALGDLVVFQPNQNHTLFVKQESRIIVVRFPPKTEKQEIGERKSVPLPGELETLREKTLGTDSHVKEILQQIEEELGKMNR